MGCFIMSKSDIWMPLYIGDYLADTQLLTTEQHGAYFLLILAYWRNKGPIPADDKVLSAICKMPPSEWKKAKPVIEKFFDKQDGYLKHKRIDSELERSTDKRSVAVKKARLGALVRHAKSVGYEINTKSSNVYKMLEALPEALPEALLEALLGQYPDDCLKQYKSQSQSQSQSQSPFSLPLPEEEFLSTTVVDTNTGEVLFDEVAR
jgi:uncharacterized protein YdaU (DUF1376 family)